MRVRLAAAAFAILCSGPAWATDKPDIAALEKWCAPLLRPAEERGKDGPRLTMTCIGLVQRVHDRSRHQLVQLKDTPECKPVIELLETRNAEPLARTVAERLNAEPPSRLDRMRFDAAEYVHKVVLATAGDCARYGYDTTALRSDCAALQPGAPSDWATDRRRKRCLKQLDWARGEVRSEALRRATSCEGMMLKIDQLGNVVAIWLRDNPDGLMSRLTGGTVEDVIAQALSRAYGQCASFTVQSDAAGDAFKRHTRPKDWVDGVLKN